MSHTRGECRCFTTPPPRGIAIKDEMGIMQINPRASQAPVLAQDILTGNALRRRGEPCCCIGCRRRRSKDRHQRDGIQGGDVCKRVHEGAAPSAHNVNAPPSVCGMPCMDVQVRKTIVEYSSSWI